MVKILHIIASPREEKSRTLKISTFFLEEIKKKHPDWVIDELNLVKEKLPPLGIKRVDGKYMLLSGKELFGDIKEAWEEMITHINRFLKADLYIISTPMWNFSIPYMLKHYIDIIVQPGFLFRYTEKGTEGLVKDKKMIVITSRGGQYISKEMLPFDHEEPYLRTIFSFVGITDITFVNAEPMDLGFELSQKKIQEAQLKAKALAMSL